MIDAVIGNAGSLSVASLTPIASSSIGATISIVVAAIVVALTGMLTRSSRSLFRDVREVKDALITPTVTPLLPNPEPRLIDQVKSLSVRVDEYHVAMSERSELGNKLMLQMDTFTTSLDNYDVQLASLDSKVKTILAATTTLVADSKENGGGTSKDSLVRIEKEQKRVADALQREGAE